MKFNQACQRLRIILFECWQNERICIAECTPLNILTGGPGGAAFRMEIRELEGKGQKGSLLLNWDNGNFGNECR